ASVVKTHAALRASFFSVLEKSEVHPLQGRPISPRNGATTMNAPMSFFSEGSAMRIPVPELSRRAVLSVLAAAATLGLAQPSLGSSPMANVQAPAFYRFKVGGFECTVVSDGPLRLGEMTAQMFKGYTQERIDELLNANFLDK